ncbi:MAG: MBL fold metallo-hydrolase [Gammaproteobacteria bacterium]|nr:MBL fold metallo-hydrolase [Gammaproteobacteria bacterium]
MRIRHLNCASMCPPSRRFVQGEGGWLERGHIVCHCLLIEGRGGLILIDTGLGSALMERRVPLHADVKMLGVQLDPACTAKAQIEALGYQAADVRDIVVTHLDFDHAGGLGDFPQARIHVYGVELDAARARRGFVERSRYWPELWSADTRWLVHPEAGQRWFDFDAVRALPGEDAEVLLVPLAGHTRGHAGVAVKNRDGWLLHCGDAYFFHTEIAVDPYCPAGLSLFQRLLAADNRRRLHNQVRLQQLKREHGDVELFCAHCPHELRAHQMRQQPAAGGH